MVLDLKLCQSFELVPFLSLVKNVKLQKPPHQNRQNHHPVILRPPTGWSTSWATCWCSCCWESHWNWFIKALKWAWFTLLVSLLVRHHGLLVSSHLRLFYTRTSDLCWSSFELLWLFVCSQVLWRVPSLILSVRWWGPLGGCTPW